VEIPSVYMVFHEFFFKSSVGDTQWKKACLDATDSTASFAPHQGEAFAMILLKNNYFAWLWENRLTYKVAKDNKKYEELKNLLKQTDEED
jgi:hypothetical protein